ncbi:hypothetical protein [Xanthomonas oryzae]|uniref:hypothetical protein n=1 Tax=Xanthomonas oryzae TaxID=347 RepID=UPI000B20DD87|nr:hypothetical protein [Xanthomonas oryzae]
MTLGIAAVDALPYALVYMHECSSLQCAFVNDARGVVQPLAPIAAKRRRLMRAPESAT